MPTSPPKDREYEVFLCHNSEDKPIVRQLRDALQACGVRTWFDEDQLIPGRPWQVALEKAIQSIGAAAICVGPSGIGPWQNNEMRAYIEQFVNEDTGVIPVVLPGADEAPELPPFLRAFTWVDLRDEHSAQGLHRLICGIRGQKPGETPICKPLIDAEQTGGNVIQQLAAGATPESEDHETEPLIADELLRAISDGLNSNDEQSATEPPPDPEKDETEAFIAEELLRAICDQLNSDKEPFPSIRAHLIRALTDPAAGESDLSLEFLERVLGQKLNDVMLALNEWLSACDTLEQGDELRRLIDRVAATGVNANSIQELRKDLRAGHLRVPQETNIELCEVVFTALYNEPATWTLNRQIDPAICLIESPSIKPHQRALDIRRRLVETYFKDQISRGVGESESDYTRRLDDFVLHGLPKVLETEQEDKTPWFVLFLEKAAQVKETLGIVPELWDGILKVEISDAQDRVVYDAYKLRARLMKMYKRLDKLQGKGGKGIGQ